MMRFRYIVWSCVLSILVSCVEPVQQGDVPATSQAKSPKRGVAFSFDRLEDLPLLSPAVSWSYNWGNAQSEEAALWFDTNDVDFCPMCWNQRFDAEKIRAYVALHPDTKYLLGYNEPNLTDQCNLTPFEAAQYWQEVVALAKELNLKLVSPAMNYGTLEGYGDPIKWLDEFFACEGVSLSDIDAIAVHCYMASPSAMKDYIERFVKYGKPIWVTEFCAWEKTVGSVEAQMDYMCAVLNYMEQSPLVERYAWFIPRAKGAVDAYPYMQLLDHEMPTALTPLGRIYTAFSSFDKHAFLPLSRTVKAYQYTALSTDRISLRVDDTESRNVGKSQVYVNNFQAGMWMDYQVQVSEAKPLQIAYASIISSQVCIYVDGEAVALADMPKTKGLNQAETFTTEVVLPEGYHTLRIEIRKGSCNMYSFYV